MAKKGRMPAGLKRYWASKRRARASGGSLRYRNSAPRKAKFTIPLAVVGGFLPIATFTYQQVKSGGINSLQYVTKRIIPYDKDANGGKGAISTQYLGQGLYPIIAGWLIHYLVGGKLGVNRMLSRAGVPLIRL
jgi:hypothetical protein